MPMASNSSQKRADGPPRLGLGHVVIDDGLGGQPVELGEFGMELTDLVLPPGRRAERVVGDRGQHEEAGVGRIQAQPFCAFHAGFLPSPGTIGSLWPTAGDSRSARALSKGWLRLWDRASRLAPVGAWCWLYFRPSS